MNKLLTIFSIMLVFLLTSSSVSASSELSRRAGEITLDNNEKIEETTYPKSSYTEPEHTPYRTGPSRTTYATVTTPPAPNLKIVPLTPEDRDLIERKIMGEAGGSYRSAALVAQCMRDYMYSYNKKTANELFSSISYYASTDKEPTPEVKQAVVAIFDNGYSAVNHRLIYFYNPSKVRNKFHESQVFVLEYGGHRYFDRRDK